MDLAEDINTSASFGQKNNDDEEAPIIVAQRFLNIFRQLHIFSDERREAFNKMLLEQPAEVKAIFQNLPGGTPLQEYMEDLEQKSKGLEPIRHKHTKKSTILQDAISENASAAAPTSSPGGIINGDNFARILASSLAQSNAEIIRELQNIRPVSLPGGKGGKTVAGGPMTLVADESFTNIISKALSEAIESSEKKRLEDNKMIARSFTELQENLTKLIEQNGQINFIPDQDGSGKVSAAPFPMKGLVDDLVKAQSVFLKETTQNQKEELSSIISTAIRESQKVSTQALIESFKKINEEKIPTPITYAASSPKGQATMESVEQALKAQGKEFSSIISMALKESQKNSAQTIIETLESLKKDTAASGQNNLKVEEIMRMQANLFRDIARAQNQEFSALISSALKESQKQSTQAIIAALSQLQTAAPKTIAVPVPMTAMSQQEQHPAQPSPTVQSVVAAPLPADFSATPIIDKYREENPLEDAALFGEDTEETPKKKKKKKKKKNKEAEAITETTAAQAQETPVSEGEAKAAASSNDKKADASKQPVEPAQKTTSAESAGSKTDTDKTKAEKKENAEKQTSVNDEQAPAKAEEKKAEDDTPKISPILQKLMNLSNQFASMAEVQDKENSEDWGWGINESKEDSVSSYNDNTPPAGTAEYADSRNDANEEDGTYYADAEAVDGEEGQDWEWEYEEVPEDEAVEGEEGEDWEWEYEEVPEGEAVEGEEGEDWEWEYEEVPEEPAAAAAAADEDEGWEWEYEDTQPEETPFQPFSFGNFEDTEAETFHSPDEFAQSSEIVLDELPQFVLLGLEDENFHDPYIENNDDIG